MRDGKGILLEGYGYFLCFSSINSSIIFLCPFNYIVNKVYQFVTWGLALPG